MRCTRCTGIQVPELISEGGIRALALRCVCCGDVTDQVITRNRRRPRYYGHDRRARTPVYGNRKWDRAGSRPFSIDQP